MAASHLDLLLQTKSVLVDTANSLQASLLGADTDPVAQNEIWHALDEVEGEISRIKRAILAIVGGSLVLAPPSEQVIAETQRLCDRVEEEIRTAAQISAVVGLVATLSGAVSRILNKP